MPASNPAYFQSLCLHGRCQEPLDARSTKQQGVSIGANRPAHLFEVDERALRREQNKPFELSEDKSQPNPHDGQTVTMRAKSTNCRANQQAP